MKNKKIKALLSKTVAVGIAASMTASIPVMAENTDNVEPSLSPSVEMGGGKQGS